MEKIGLIDFDFLSTKQLCYYNFGVLLVSSYYLEQGSKVRLIINLKHENLTTYDKIYIFKDYKTKIQPIHLIDDYYSLPVEEYGEGFNNRPLLPCLPNLIYTHLRTDVYKPIIYYIKNGGNNFSLGKNWNENYTPTKFFFEEDGELLLREEPKDKKLLVYDTPDIFFTTELGIKKMTELFNKSIIKFVKPLHIGIIKPKYWDTIFFNSKLVLFKERLYASESDPYFNEFAEWCKTHDIGTFKITIKTEDGVKWLSKRGGKYYGNYGNYRLKVNDETRVDQSTSEENISTRYEWFTTKRPIKNNRRSREGASETQRRKYLPSEQDRRWKEYRTRRNAIKRGR